jgi:hypothetical protein
MSPEKDVLFGAESPVDEEKGFIRLERKIKIDKTAEASKDPVVLKSKKMFQMMFKDIPNKGLVRTISTESLLLHRNEPSVERDNGSPADIKRSVSVGAIQMEKIESAPRSRRPSSDSRTLKVETKMPE